MQKDIFTDEDFEPPGRYNGLGAWEIESFIDYIPSKISEKRDPVGKDYHNIKLQFSHCTEVFRRHFFPESTIIL